MTYKPVECPGHQDYMNSSTRLILLTAVALGVSLPEFKENKPKIITQYDLDKLEKAKLKREKKALKLSKALK